jgi:hypothetical protein
LLRVGPIRLWPERELVVEFFSPKPKKKSASPTGVFEETWPDVFRQLLSMKKSGSARKTTHDQRPQGTRQPRQQLRSTGPKTAAGRSASVRNARRHGLRTPVLADPALSAEVEAIAQKIAGSQDVS